MDRTGSWRGGSSIALKKQDCGYQIWTQPPLKWTQLLLAKQKNKPKDKHFLTHLRQSYKYWIKLLAITAPFNASQLMFYLRNCWTAKFCCLKFWLSIMSLKLHLSGYEDHSAKFRNGKGTSYILEPAFPFKKISADRSELWQKLTMFLKYSMIQIAK